MCLPVKICSSPGVGFCGVSGWQAAWLDLCWRWSSFGEKHMFLCARGRNQFKWRYGGEERQRTKAQLVLQRGRSRLADHPTERTFDAMREPPAFSSVAHPEPNFLAKPQPISSTGLEVGSHVPAPEGPRKGTFRSVLRSAMTAATAFFVVVVSR